MDLSLKTEDSPDIVIEHDEEDEYTDEDGEEVKIINSSLSYFSKNYIFFQDLLSE